MSYYKNNQKLLFRRKDSAFSQHFQLSDIENMTPFERTVYLILINQAIDAYEIESNQSKG